VRVFHSEQFSWTDPETGEERTSTRIADLPLEMQRQIEELRRGGPTSGRQFTYRDPSGVEHTYSSLDEMPPEVRRFFDRADPA
jgi:hypothetical protein